MPTLTAVTEICNCTSEADGSDVPVPVALDSEIPSIVSKHAYGGAVVGGVV